MKLYYFASNQAQQTEARETEVTPKRMGTQAEHLAYAIASVTKLARNFVRSSHIERRFTDIMNETEMLKSFLTHNPLPQHFDFTVRDIASRIAHHFVLPTEALDQPSEARIILYNGPLTCPIYLSELIYGVKFNDDFYTYELEAAHLWIVGQRKNTSPRNRAIWNRIQDIWQIDLNAQALATNKTAQRQLHEITTALATFAFLQANNQSLVNFNVNSLIAARERGSNNDITAAIVVPETEVRLDQRRIATHLALGYAFVLSALYVFDLRKDSEDFLPVLCLVGALVSAAYITKDTFQVLKFLMQTLRHAYSPASHPREELEEKPQVNNAWIRPARGFFRAAAQSGLSALTGWNLSPSSHYARLLPLRSDNANRREDDNIIPSQHRSLSHR